MKKAEEDQERKWVPVYRSEQVEETADRSRDERVLTYEVSNRQLQIQIKNPALGLHVVLAAPVTRYIYLFQPVGLRVFYNFFLTKKIYNTLQLRS